jgi:PPOX class probable F420-dependent enzyme
VPSGPAPPPAGYFAPLAASRYCSLTTFKRDGTPVATTVNVVVEGDLAYFRTWSTSGKAKRLRHTAQVEARPSGPSGKPKGEISLPGLAVLLEGAESRKAAGDLARQHPLLHGLLVPRIHRLRGWTTQQYRLDPPPGGDQSGPTGWSPTR